MTISFFLGEDLDKPLAEGGAPRIHYHHDTGQKRIGPNGDVQSLNGGGHVDETVLRGLSESERAAYEEVKKQQEALRPKPAVEEVAVAVKEAALIAIPEVLGLSIGGQIGGQIAGVAALTVGQATVGEESKPEAAAGESIIS